MRCKRQKRQLTAFVELSCIYIVYNIMLHNFQVYSRKWFTGGCLYIHGSFLGAFAKLRMVTISFVMSVRLNVHTHVKTRLPLNGFS